MRFSPIFVCGSALAATLACAQTTPKAIAPSASPKTVSIVQKTALLPDAFAGWVAVEAPKVVTDPAQADPANAAALKEYDFSDGMLATYKRGSETLTLRALRFQDASGAYGAYTFYRPTGWPKADVGTGGASSRNRVLFWLGNTFVDANFSSIGPMSGSELRELAGQIPVPAGTKTLAPPILSNLPQDSLDGQSSHYAVGPAGYAGSGGVLPPDLVGFDRGAEAVTAGYSLRSGPATLTIVDYPTPQMAMAQETRIRDYIKAGSQPQNPWPKPLQDSDQASLEVRRSGPLVILVSGDAIPEESHKLIERVHFDAELTSIPQQGESEVSKTYHLLSGIVMLVLVGSLAAILLGLFLGGGRALYRIARGKPASSMQEVEFIRLHLED